MSLSHYLFSPRGRLNRAQYWLYIVVSILIMATVLIAIMTAISVGLLYDPRGAHALPPAALAIFGVYIWWW